MKTKMPADQSRAPGYTAEKELDLKTKLVRVSGEGLDDAVLRAAIEEAGYEAV